MSTLATAALTEQEATRLTERIRLTAHNYSEARAKLQELVSEAKEGNAHLALGYASWTAYLSEVLGEEPMRLARSERQEMVQLLSSEGMSTRAIAPIVGAHHDTVASDLKSAPVGNPTPTPVQGMDGKAYTKPESQPAAPKRRPITDQSSEAGWELAKTVEKLERIITDDRFPANREQVSNNLKQHLINSIQTLETLLNTL